MSRNSRVRNERGAVLAIVAGAMIFICGMAALAIDVGHALSARTGAQRTADAMALAAASAFIDDPQNAEPLAELRATEYAQNNPVYGVSAAFDPATDMQIDLAEKRVRVWAHFTEARGNPMRTFFARVLGIDDVDIVAMAAAEATRADRVGCLTPWAVGDLWQDTYTGPKTSVDKFDYDDADKSATPTEGDTFDNYCPCATTEDGEIIIDPEYLTNGYGQYVCNPSLSGGECTGYGSQLRDDGTYQNDVGRVLTLKPGNPAQSWSPGWFMAWRPPDNMGGADYRENIIRCIDESLFDTNSIVPVDTEQGNMIGPTIQGVEERIGDDQHYWQPGCIGGTQCVRGPTCPDGGCTDFSRRLVTVPLMDPTEVMRNGLTEIQFRGFMRLFLDTPSSNDITGHILGLGGAAGAAGEEDEGGAGALPLVLRLVE